MSERAEALIAVGVPQEVAESLEFLELEVAGFLDPESWQGQNVDERVEFICSRLVDYWGGFTWRLAAGGWRLAVGDGE